jgi:hypothetical protein
MPTIVQEKWCDLGDWAIGQFGSGVDELKIAKALFLVLRT